MSNKKFYRRFNGYHVCIYGVRCTCSPPPKDRKRAHRLAIKKAARVIERIERAEVSDE